MRRHLFSLLAAGLALAACRSDSPNNPIDSNSIDVAGGVVRIQDVQNDAMAPGTAVTLSGVVVTAIDGFGAKTSNFWVEEPEGGPNSGVLIFKAAPTDVAALAPGDIVTISGGTKEEFALSGTGGDTTGRTDTEIGPPMGGSLTVTKTGSGTVPAPAVVDALAIGKMYDASAPDGGAAFSAAWEQWEGVLVTVDNVAALTGVKSFGSTTPVPADNYSFGVTGVAKVEGSLADITAAGIVRNTCFASVTGVVDYFFDYLILPRSTSDMAMGGTNCPAPENSMTLCTDTTDNDGNGFSDCADDNCIVGYGPGPGTCRVSTTINAIDTAVPTGGVEITNAFVSAISGDGLNFWVANSKTAASGQGLYVFSSGTTLPTTNFAVGSQVTVIGSVSDYKPSGNSTTQVLREYNALSVTTAAGTATGFVGVVGQTAATLIVEATGRPYVGSLVTLTNVKVVTAADATMHNVAGLSQASTAFEAAGDIHVLTSAANTCFSTLTGIWTYDVYNKKFAIEPTAEGNTVGGTCP